MGSIREDIGTGADWIASALSSSGYFVDFSPESLWEIDRFFDDHSQGGAAKPHGLLSQDLGQRMFAIGAYMGEVVRRNLGGDWVGNDGDPQAEVNVALRLASGVRCWPVQRAMKRFKSGPADGIAAWGSGLGLLVGSPPRPQQPDFFKRLFRRR
jgi:hypothetical protein